MCKMDHLNSIVSTGRTNPSVREGIHKGLDKQNFPALNFKYFLMHHVLHMFWVFKRTVLLRRFF